MPLGGGKENYARSIIVKAFSELAGKFFEGAKSLKVAVVGGYFTDPEIRALQENGFRLDLQYFGVDSNSKFFDLNFLNEESRDKFDLVLCSQVLEHVWNHENAFLNLKMLLKEGGLLWISCPYSNRAHGLPDFYSAGFTSEFLVKNLESKGMQIIFSREIGSKRLYQALHSMPVWLSRNANMLPLFFAFDDRPLWKATFLRIRFLPDLLLLQFRSKRIQSKPLTNTDSFVAATNLDTSIKSKG